MEEETTDVVVDEEVQDAEAKTKTSATADKQAELEATNPLIRKLIILEDESIQKLHSYSLTRHEQER